MKLFLWIFGLGDLDGGEHYALALAETRKEAEVLATQAVSVYGGLAKAMIHYMPDVTEEINEFSHKEIYDILWRKTNISEVLKTQDESIDEFIEELIREKTIHLYKWGRNTYNR